MGFLSHPHYTLPTVLLHFSLTASSFGFAIPKFRIKDGTRIWPEYRMHAMVFVCRSLVTILVYWYEDTNGLERQYDSGLIICLATLLAADLCSWSVGVKYRSQSVRGVDTHPAAKYFISIIQFLATAGIIMGMRRYSFPFMSVFVMQLTPFLGTLRRKMLMGAQIGVAIYVASLVTSYIISNFYSPGASPKMIRVTATIGLLAALWRLNPILPNDCKNKYLIWTTVGLLVRKHRQFLFHDERVTDERVNAVFAGTVAAVLALGYWKINHGSCYAPDRKLA